ncbi:MAG: hypothetical protein ABSA30_02710 [Candidatus Aminicenantales bacterium]
MVFSLPEKSPHLFHSVSETALDSIDGFPLGFGDDAKFQAFQEIEDDDASLRLRERGQGLVNSLPIRRGHCLFFRRQAVRSFWIRKGQGRKISAPGFRDISQAIDDTGQQIALQAPLNPQAAARSGEGHKDVMDGVLGGRSIRNHGQGDGQHIGFVFFINDSKSVGIAVLKVFQQNPVLFPSA